MMIGFVAKMLQKCKKERRLAIFSLKIDTCNISCLNVEMNVLLLIVNDLIC